jgi:hypothetical protein
MATKVILDPETKMELLIKLAFGIPLKTLAEEYDLTELKIVNLRKNNYTKYNEFFEYWKIDKEVACLGLTPKYERALSVVKKFYKNKVRIVSIDEIYYNEKFVTINEILKMADSILKKDNINDFATCTYLIKNYY